MNDRLLLRFAAMRLASDIPQDHKGISGDWSVYL
jgi:hypothetical protein